MIVSALFLTIILLKRAEETKDEMTGTAKDIG
jgi:hypothetical protein